MNQEKAQMISRQQVIDADGNDKMFKLGKEIAAAYIAIPLGVTPRTALHYYVRGEEEIAIHWLVLANEVKLRIQKEKLKKGIAINELVKQFREASKLA